MRSAPLLLVAGLAVASGAIWLTLSLLGSDDPQSGLSPEDGPESAVIVPGADPAVGASLPSLEGLGGEPEAGATRTLAEGSQPEDWSGEKHLLAGRVVLPPGLPKDERLLVIAISESMRAKDIYESDGPAAAAWLGETTDTESNLILAVEVADDGSFELELPVEVSRIHLAVSGRYLYTQVTLQADAPESGVQLEPELGAWITGRLTPPDGVEVTGADFKELEIDLGPDMSAGFDTFSIGETASPRESFVEADGSFELRAVRCGAPQASIVKPERFAAVVQRDIVVQPGEHRELVLALNPGATLEGVAVDDSGAPLSGVEIGVRRRGLMGRVLDDLRETTTDEEGRFKLIAVTPGELDLHGRVDGFRDGSMRIDDLIGTEQRSGLRLVLDRGASIAGQVRFPDGTPAVGASVSGSLEPTPMAPGASEMDRVHPATTDEEGRFVVRGLKDTRYRLAATLEVEEGERAGKWKARADSVAAGASDILITLEAPITLHGRVLALPKAAPIEKFAVTATLKGSGAMFGIGAERVQHSFSERSMGEFELEGLSSGTWEVRVRADGFGASEQETVDLPRMAAAPPVEFHLPPAGMIAGRVVDPTGLPVPRASVRPEMGLAERIEAAQSSSTTSAQTDAEGRFLIEGLDPGSIQLVASREGWANSETVPSDVVAGELTSDVVLTLRRGGSLTGEVLDDEGNPDAGATIIIQIVPSYNEQHFRTSDTDGRFHIEHLEPGSWQILRTPELFGAGGSSGEGGSDDMSNFLSNLEIEFVEIVEGGTEHVVLGAQPEDPIDFNCRIVHAGQPVPNAVVTLIPKGSGGMGGMKIKSTDEDGRLEVVLEESGDYNIIVQPGRTGAEQNNIEFYEEIPEGVDQHSIELELPGGRVSGRVDMAGRGPLGHCRVTLHVDAGISNDTFYGGHYTETSTDKDGNYDIPYLRAGRYAVSAGGVPLGGLLGGDSEGGRLVRSGVRVGEGEWIKGLDFEIPAAAELTGLVHDIDGQPIIGAAVFVRNEDGLLLERFSFTTTNANGEFVYKGIAPGRYTVSSRLGERASLDGAPVRVRSGESETATVVLEPGTVLLVQVVDAEGQAVGARMTVTDKSGLDYASMMTMEEVIEDLGRSSENREISIGPLAPGNYRIRATTTDGREAEKPLRLTGRPQRKVRLRVR